MEILEHHPIKHYTTFKVGGPARYFTAVTTEAEFLEAAAFAHSQKLDVFILGGGSNVLVSDSGFNGLVILNQIVGITAGEDGVLEFMSGESWDKVAALSVSKNWAGLECLSGVPGTAGGAVVQNIGAYGQTLADCVQSVTAIDIITGEIREFLPSECNFEYRGSVFKHNPGKYFILKAKLSLIPDGAPLIKYHDLIDTFQNTKNPTLSQVREAVIKLRSNKGMIFHNDNSSYCSIGSYFKNPVISQAAFERIRGQLQDPEIYGDWYWELPGAMIKVAAARILQKSGFPKGYHEDKVGVSPKQPLAIINLGQAKASEIRIFAQKIKDTVKQKFNVDLTEEVMYIGEHF